MQGHHLNKVLIDDNTGQVITCGDVTNEIEDCFGFFALQNIRYADQQFVIISCLKF
jgi:hypothetical protein